MISPILSLNIRHFPIRHNQLLLAHLIIHKFPLTNMPLLLPLRRPNLIAEHAPLLSLCVFVRTLCIETRVEFAQRLDVGEHTALSLAVGSVPAHRHCGMAEGAGGVHAVWEEFTVLLGLVAGFFSG